MKTHSFALLLALSYSLSFLTACSDKDDTEVATQLEDIEIASLPDNVILPAVSASFDWQLDDVTTDNTFAATVIDVDAFSTTAATVQHFKDQGKIVIAYLSVGSAETFRDDYNDFPSQVLGTIYEGFEDEKWLDITNIDAIAPILRARFDMIANKGFDGIEPDNINGYQNNTGFNLTETDAINFSRWLINEAHIRGLHIGQKNAEEIIPTMVTDYDWLLFEDAYSENFETTAQPYITANKAVFMTEYKDQMTETTFLNTVCPDALSNSYTAILKDRDLTHMVINCN